MRVNDRFWQGVFVALWLTVAMTMAGWALAEWALGAETHVGASLSCITYGRKEFPIRLPQRAHLVLCYTPDGEVLGIEIKPNGVARCTGHGTVVGTCTKVDLCGVRLQIGCSRE